FGNLFDFCTQEAESSDGVARAILCDEIANFFQVTGDEGRKVQPHQRAFFAGGTLGLVCEYLLSSRSKTGSGSRPSESSATAASHCLRISARPCSRRLRLCVQSRSA